MFSTWTNTGWDMKNKKWMICLGSYLNSIYLFITFLKYPVAFYFPLHSITQPISLSSLESFSVTHRTVQRFIIHGALLVNELYSRLCPLSWLPLGHAYHTAGCKMPTRKLMEHSPTPWFLPRGTCLWRDTKVRENVQKSHGDGKTWRQLVDLANPHPCRSLSLRNNVIGFSLNVYFIRLKVKRAVYSVKAAILKSQPEVVSELCLHNII